MNLPFAQKEVIIGNPKSRIGICTLWSPREKFVHKHLNGLMDEIALVGNLYSAFGVGILIRNYLANPQLRVLIVTGTELGFAKTALKNLGKDNSLPAKLFLEAGHISRFLDQVRIIYVANNDVSTLISNESFRCFEEPKNFEPIIVPLPDPKTDIFPAPDSGHLIKANTIADGYYALLKEIRFFGHTTGQDSEGYRRQELWELNMVITSQKPDDFGSIPHPEYDKKQIQKYCEDFWNGTEPEDLAYRYGHIIRYGFGDQVQAVIKAFQDKAETFRTVISLWNPDIVNGSITATDPPCICTIHPRIIGDYLHQWAYIRTNDMFSGWPLNAAALRYFQYCLLEQLKVVLNRPELRLGELGITSGSAHLYERDWLRVDAMIKEKKVSRFQADPKGNFEVNIEDNNIVVRHFSPDGALLQIFKGANADELNVKITPFISQVEHALYLGSELRKAEEKLR